MMICPNCGNIEIIKFGHIKTPRREQRYRCKACDYQFIMDTVRPDIIKLAIQAAKKPSDIRKLIAAVK